MIRKPALHSLLRAVKNLLQILVITGLMLVCVYLGAILSINLFLGSGRGRVVINDALRGYALREFSARRIYLSPALTLTIDDFALSRALGFANGTAMKATKVSVRVKPIAFLGHQSPIKIDADLEAHGQRIHMETLVLADGARRQVAVKSCVIDKRLFITGDVDMSGKIPNYNLTINGDRATWERLMELATGNNAVRTNLRSKVCLLITGNPDSMTVENKAP
jgi:hypothetical protein